MSLCEKLFLYGVAMVWQKPGLFLGLKCLGTSVLSANDVFCRVAGVFRLRGLVFLQGKGSPLQNAQMSEEKRLIPGPEEIVPDKTVNKIGKAAEPEEEGQTGKLALLSGEVRTAYHFAGNTSSMHKKCQNGQKTEDASYYACFTEHLQIDIVGMGEIDQLCGSSCGKGEALHNRSVLPGTNPCEGICGKDLKGIAPEGKTGIVGNAAEGETTLAAEEKEGDEYKDWQAKREDKTLAGKLGMGDEKGKGCGCEGCKV